MGREADTLLTAETKFTRVCDIEVLRDHSGQVLLDLPQHRYRDLHRVSLNRYGEGPFCRFQIDKRTNIEGVYLLKVGDRVQYVSECEDLAKRFNLGYGRISPKNCFVGGQPTNCKVNQLVLQQFQAGHSIEVWFTQVRGRAERRQLERDLVSRLHPPWNGRVSLLDGGETRRNHASPLSVIPPSPSQNVDPPIRRRSSGTVNQRMSYEDLLRIARRLSGQELRTVGGLATFRVEVRQGRDEEAIYCIPASSQMERRLGPDTLKALDYFNQTGSMRPGDYASRTHNASYILALISYDEKMR